MPDDVWDDWDSDKEGGNAKKKVCVKHTFFYTTTRTHKMYSWSLCSSIAPNVLYLHNHIYSHTRAHAHTHSRTIYARKQPQETAIKPPLTPAKVAQVC